MFNDISNKVQEAYHSGVGKVLLPAMIVASGAAGAANAQAGRIAEIDVDPAARGYAGETVDLTQFQVKWYRTADPNVFGYEVSNKTNPEHYLVTRGTVNIPDGGTGSVDGIVALPADPITDSSELGSLAPNAEVPGSETGRDLDVEVRSSLGLGSPFMALTQTGSREFYFDLNSPHYSSQENALENTVSSWNDGTVRATKNTYHSSQGNPAGWSPGQLKVWKVIGVDTNDYNGQIDIPNATIRLSKQHAIQSTLDEEVFSAMFGTYSSPFANQTLPVVPETYKRLFDNMNFSVILNDGSQVMGVPFGGTGLPQLGELYVYGADDGSGVFPGTVNENDLVQVDDLNSEGYAKSTITEPPVANENTSWGSVKASFR